MSIFSGLGQGLGKAASGYLGGSIAAEKENYRRGQVEAEREQKKQLLALKKKEGDPDEKARQFYGQLAVQNQATMDNPANRAYFLGTPEGQAHFKRLQDKQKIYVGIVSRQIRPGDVDQNVLSNMPEPADEQTVRLGTPEGVGGSLPFLGAPGSRMAPAAGLQAPPAMDRTANPVQNLHDVEARPDQWSGGANIPLDATGGPPLPPQTGPPDIGPAPKKEPAPKPISAIDRYKYLQAHPPVVQPLPGERPVDTARRQAQSDSAHRAQLEDAYRAVTLEDTARTKKAGADIAESNAKYRPEQNRVGLNKNIAQTEQARSQASLNRAIAPIKVGQGKATLEKTRVETKAIPERVAAQKRQVAAAERQASASEGRLQLGKETLAETKRRYEISLRKGARTGEEKHLKDLIAQDFKTLNAYKKMASGSDTPKFDEHKRTVAQNRFDRNMKRLEQLQKQPDRTESRTSTTTFKGRPDQAKAAGVLGKKPRLPKGVDDSDYKAVSGLIGRGKFDGFVRGLQGTARAQAKAIYKHKTGRDWGG